MRTLSLSNRDLARVNNTFVYLESAACMKQRIESSLKCDLESWFLNPSLGINWFGIYDQKYVSDRLIKSEVRRVLINDPEVTSINKIDVTFDRINRRINVVFKVSSEYGTIEGSI